MSSIGPTKECFSTFPGEEKKDDATVDTEPINNDSGSSWSSANNQKPPKRTNTQTWIFLGALLRSVLFELPLLLLFSLVVATFLLQKVRDSYLLPQIELQRWTPERAEREITYYHRTCTEKDISALDQPELVITEDMSTDDAVEHMLTHGVSIYPRILSPETAKPLRDFIIRQNQKNEDMIGVIENENRWSFRVKVDQDPSIPKALTEILSNKKLVAAIESIAGENPAIIEFTGITSAYGAKEQRWHTDVVPEGSAAKYARNFVPSYSLFIPLQNTTARMGATEICPGSYMCGDGDAAIEMCAEHGWQVSGSPDNWPLGYGALVNQQTVHRGTAHSDPNAMERVVFILTFAPRPEYGPKQVETRYIGTGGSYSLHWSQWGFTLRDYRDSQKYMRYPWRLLRALGIYHGGHHWGFDFFTQATARAGNDEGYGENELVELIQAGGISFLPLWMQIPESEIQKYYEQDMSLVRYVSDTLDRCHSILKTFYATGLVAYVVVAATARLFTHRRSRAIYTSLSRLLFIHIVITTVASYAWNRLSTSYWAKTIEQHRLFQIYQIPRGPKLPSTLPNEDDVLILDDFQGARMASFERVLDYFHPGNRRWREMTALYSVGYNEMSDKLKLHLCESILEWNLSIGSRTLTKTYMNEWGVLNHNDAIFFCNKQLLTKANAFVRAIIHEKDRLQAETKYGWFRDTAMHIQHIPALLSDMERKMLRDPNNRNLILAQRINSTHMPRRSFLQHLPVKAIALPLSKRNRKDFKKQIKDPYVRAWLKQGDVVEATYQQLFLGKLKFRKPFKCFI